MEKLNSAWKCTSLQSVRYGVFEIWVNEELARNLMEPLWDNIQDYYLPKKTIDDEIYIGIFCGWSCNLKETLRILGKAEYTPSVLNSYAFARVIKALVRSSSSLRSVRSVVNECFVEWQSASSDFDARADLKAQLNRSDIYWPLNIKGNNRIPAVRHKLEELLNS